MRYYIYGSESYGSESYGSESYGSDSYGSESYGSESYVSGSYGSESYGSRRSNLGHVTQYSPSVLTPWTVSHDLFSSATVSLSIRNQIRREILIIQSFAEDFSKCSFQEHQYRQHNTEVNTIV